MGIFDVGPLELIVIFIVALLVFGPNRLPEFLGQLGRWVRTIRRLSDDVTREFVRELNLDDARTTSYTYQAPMPPPPPYIPPISEPSPLPTSFEGGPAVTDGADGGQPATHGPAAPTDGAHLGDEDPDGPIPFVAHVDGRSPAELPITRLNGASSPAEPVVEQSSTGSAP